jgi:hypothetical protein
MNLENSDAVLVHYWLIRLLPLSPATFTAFLLESTQVGGSSLLSHNIGSPQPDSARMDSAHKVAQDRFRTAR